MFLSNHFLRWSSGHLIFITRFDRQLELTMRLLRWRHSNGGRPWQSLARVEWRHLTQVRPIPSSLHQAPPTLLQWIGSCLSPTRSMVPTQCPRNAKIHQNSSSKLMMSCQPSALRYDLGKQHEISLNIKMWSREADCKMPKKYLGEFVEFPLIE